MRRDEALTMLRAAIPELRERFGVSSLSLFGSTARDEAGQGSDLDVLVVFEPDSTTGLFGLSRLKSFLSRECGCDVHLLTPGAVHPGLRPSIERDAVRAG
jgi:predicted nucleotidyltransferase